MQVGELQGPFDVAVVDAPEPRLIAGSALIDVDYCAIGGPDVEAFRSGQTPTPAWFGRAWVGRVVGCDPAGALRIGSTAVAGVARPCGSCAPCRYGADDHCDTVLSTIVGTRTPVSSTSGFAPRIRVPLDRVALLPEGADRRDGMLSEPLAVAIRAARVASLQLGETAVVIGAGTVGLLTVQLARRSGVGRIAVLEPSVMRRELACDLGADAAFGHVDGLQAWLADHQLMRSADVVFECSGSAEGLRNAAICVRPGGRVVVVGVSTTNADVTTQLLVERSGTIVPTRGYNYWDLQHGLDLLAHDELLTAVLFEPHMVSLNRIGEAFDRLASAENEVLQVVVDLRAVAA